MTDVVLKSLVEVEEAGGYMPLKCQYPCEVRNDGVLTLILKPINSAESREWDSVADAANEEGQDTLVSSLCPLVGIVDSHRGHELMNQLRVENLWVSGQVPHTQLLEQVLEVRFDAQRSDHIWVDEPCWSDGNLQPFIVEYDVIVVPRVLDCTVSACQALRRFVCVLEVVKERDRFVLSLSRPRVFVTYWSRAAGVKSPLRFILLFNL